MDCKKLCENLRKNAEWCDGNEWEIPICMGNNQRDAADAIEELQELVAFIAAERNKECDLRHRSNDNLQSKVEMYKKKYIVSETDATNLTGELATVYAEKEELKRKLEAITEMVRGDCKYCKNKENGLGEPCIHCSGFAAKEFVTGNYWELNDGGVKNG